MAAGQAQSLPADPRHVLALARRVAVLEDGVFEELAANVGETGGAVALAAVLYLGYALAGLVYTIVEGDFARLSLVQFVSREVIGGTVVGFVSWLAWVAAVRALLASMGGVSVPFDLVARVLGYALVPLAVTWVFWVPSAIPGLERLLGDASFALLIAAFVAIPLYAVQGLAVAVPEASTRSTLLIVASTYLVVVGVMALQAHFTGMAPATELYGSGARLYYSAY